MSQTLLFERVLDETRLAVIEDGALCELYIERPGDENLSGNVYLGRVENVLPGMNAAFVDIGLEKKGFLAAGDIRLFAQGDRQLAETLGKARIEALVRPGAAVPVQAIKAQPGNKGPRLSCHVTLPGRLMVLLCGVDYVGVSRKIEGEGERRRLHDLGVAIAGPGMGLILRTAAEGAGEAQLRGEYERLVALWASIRVRAEHGIPPKLLHDDNDLALRAVRDLLNDGVDALWADDAESYARLVELANILAPEYADRIRLHEGTTPLFDMYRVDAQLDKALEKYVWLKSGGSLVIEETEALTSIDVNTGKNTGKRDAEDTIFENNCEAAREIMRQLRLRDIGGIVVVDFIDMRSREHRDALLELMRECAARDRNRVSIVDMTPLGLVELTRKKARQSLNRQLLHTCSDCGGNGRVPSHETTARRAAREVLRHRRGGDGTPLLVEAAPPVCGLMKKLGAKALGNVKFKPTEDMGAGEYRALPLPTEMRNDHEG